MSTRASLVFGLLTLCLLPPGFLSAAERNIILFVTDDQSPNLGCYGDKLAVTPQVDALAADGTLFTNALATTASCSPSRSVILSGVHNHKNGMLGLQHSYHHFSCFPDIVSLTLPTVLRDHGYRSAQIGKYHVAPEASFHFDTYLKANGRSPVEMAETCQEFLTANDDRPFFLYFATQDPHRSGQMNARPDRELRPNMFGNKANRQAYPGVTEVFFDPADMIIPPFLPDTKETREELAQYYQSCARIDQGLGRLIELLKQNDLYDKTLIVFTSDHGMPFQGAKTTTYEPGLRVPFVVRNPYESKRGIVSPALISHVDIAPSLVDFAGALNRKTNGPKNWKQPERVASADNVPSDNMNGGHQFKSYHGQSWLPRLAQTEVLPDEEIYASHLAHGGIMYYPMRVVRTPQYKLIWNIAYPLTVPSATDLWDSSAWLAQYRQGPNAPYGRKTVHEYLHRPQFELFDISTDPDELQNLAADARYAEVLKELQGKLKDFQERTDDPWIQKWDHE